jgi:hypothetical protein
MDLLFQNLERFTWIIWDNWIWFLSYTEEKYWYTDGVYVKSVGSRSNKHNIIKNVRYCLPSKWINTPATLIWTQNWSKSQPKYDLVFLGMNLIGQFIANMITHQHCSIFD